MDLSGSRPRTTAEISAAVKAKQRPVHHLTDLDVYFKTAEFVGLEAAVYREEENWQELFRVLTRGESELLNVPETLAKVHDFDEGTQAFISTLLVVGAGRQMHVYSCHTFRQGQGRIERQTPFFSRLGGPFVQCLEFTVYGVTDNVKHHFLRGRSHATVGFERELGFQRLVNGFR